RPPPSTLFPYPTLFRSRVLMDGGEANALASGESRLRSVPVMNVEIENGDPARARGQRLQRGDGDRGEIAETHGLRPRRVVPGRTDRKSTRLNSSHVKIS